jgi:hypothetical protein
MTGLDVRVERGSAPDEGAAPALLITAEGRRRRPVVLRSCLLLTMAGLRVFLEPHLAYPIALREGEQCTEWIALTRLLVELEARGCDGPTRLVPLFLGPDRRLTRWANTLRGDVRGVEYRGDIFTLGLKRRPAGGLT